MSDEKGLYEGRKGQRRLKLIEKNIQRTNEEFNHNCEESPEMIYLDRQIKWEGMARLIFTLAQRDVNFRWNGLRDYGYIRLCCKWIDGNGLTTVTADAADAMMRDLLPADMCSALDDELAALEIL